MLGAASDVAADELIVPLGALERYAALRVAVVLVVLAWAFWLLGAGGWKSAEAIPFSVACGVALVAVVASRAHARRRSVGVAFVVAQLTLDVAFVSVLAWLTGGIDSLFVLAYTPAIGAGAYLLGRSGGWIAAGLCSLGFAAMLLLQPSALDPKLLYSEALLRIFALGLVGTLTGHLAERAVSADRALQAQRRTTEALAIEHGALLDQVHAGVLTTDLDGHIATANPFARTRMGDVVGRALAEVLPGMSVDTANPSWEVHRPDGQRWICSRARLPDGGQIILVDDVTELTRMRDRASRDERLVAAGRLAASMAHEIRNPLASLSGALQLLREEHPSRLIDLAVSESERLNRLVENFLGVASRPRISTQRVDVTLIAREVCEAFGRDARYIGRTNAHCEGVPAHAEVDPDRVRQTVWNLVLNGAQAMPIGGDILVTVRDADQDAPGVEVRVADRGVGISERDRERVFDPFYTTRSGGTGLGLAVVEQSARAHGGSVRVEGREGGGTVFVVWFPREVQRGEA
jgi:two-component system sensor histidine kinase PilS (NtrC family)